MIEADAQLYLEGVTGKPTQYIVVSNAGEIKRSGYCSGDTVFTQAQTSDERVFLLGPEDFFTDDGTFIVDLSDESSPTIVGKILIPVVVTSTNVLADAEDTALLSRLPTGTKMLVQGQEESEANGQIPFSVDLAGEYTLTLTHPLYLDTKVTITAV